MCTIGCILYVIIERLCIIGVIHKIDYYSLYKHKIDIFKCFLLCNSIILSPEIKN